MTNALKTAMESIKKDRFLLAKPVGFGALELRRWDLRILVRRDRIFGC